METQTREKILIAALTLLESGKAESVRMSDIAKKAGLSRQAVYLHFPTRAELLIAAARHLDQMKDIDARLAKSRAATSGPDRLNAYIDAWGGYIPEIYGVTKAFLAMEEMDEAAAAAWRDRMGAMRHGCEAAVKALKRDGVLTSGLSVKKATDVLWTLLSVHTWALLTKDCGWSQAQYIAMMKSMASDTLCGDNC